jgi:hypothetical protein
MPWAIFGRTIGQAAEGRGAANLTGDGLTVARRVLLLRGEGDRREERGEGLTQRREGAERDDDDP